MAMKTMFAKLFWIPRPASTIGWAPRDEWKQLTTPFRVHDLTGVFHDAILAPTEPIIFEFTDRHALEVRAEAEPQVTYEREFRLSLNGDRTQLIVQEGARYTMCPLPESGASPLHAATRVFFRGEFHEIIAGLS